MIQHLFAIHDSKANVFFKPYVFHNKAMAVRQFGDMVNDPETTINKHPADYTLFHFGTFNDEDAKFDLKKGKTSLANGVEFVNGKTST